MSDWEKLFALLANEYYSLPVLLIIQIITISIGLKTASNQIVGKLLLFYTSFDLTICLIDFWLICFTDFQRATVSLFIHISNTIISLIELLVYFYYFKQILPSSKVCRCSFARVKDRLILSCISLEMF